MSQDLFQQLLGYDRKSTESLNRIIEKFESRPRYVSRLIALSASEHPQIACGATWMLRAHIEANGTLSQAQTRKLINELPNITTWDAQLHICQSIGKLDLPANSAEALYAWLAPLIDHDRPFVRAWSLDALCWLARQHSSFRSKAEQALSRAADDPAGSVRARARNLQKFMAN